MPRASSDQIERLLAPHLAALFRFAWRLTRNTADAQDLVQDACIAACENPLDLVEATHPRRWLLRVLHNRFIDGARRRRQSPVVVEHEAGDLLQRASTEPTPEEMLQRADGEHQLDRAFLQLDAIQRTLLTLRVEGYGLAEIEQITGISREVLRARLHRARRKLAWQLAEQKGTHQGPCAGRTS